MKKKIFICFIVALVVSFMLARPCPCHNIPLHGCKKPCVVEE